MERIEAYPPFEIYRPPLIQPEVLPRRIRNQVATPTMSKLVCDDVDILTVLDLIISNKVLVLET